MKSGSEIAFYSDLCIACGDCEDVCPEGAIDLENPDRIDRGRCTACSKCVEDCPTTALKTVGRYYSVDNLIERLLSDRVFYDTSNGGVTFSGGEPTLYMDYVGEVMRGLKDHGIHMAIQTSGMFSLSDFETKLLPNIDLIFFDIKLMDPAKHRQFVGRGNQQILNNFIALAKRTDVEIIPRVPLVPEITATSDNLAQIADFLKGVGCAKCEFLPFNSGGVSKRIALGSRGRAKKEPSKKANADNPQRLRMRHRKVTRPKALINTTREGNSKEKMRVG
jgi:pyruvate formate lyase activating enzyme